MSADYQWFHKVRVYQSMKLAQVSHCLLKMVGGNTGLVGGSIPVLDELVISMAKMNRIESVSACLYFKSAPGCIEVIPPQYSLMTYQELYVVRSAIH